MSDPPSRDVALGILAGRYDEDAGARIVADLLRLVAAGELKTEAEWRAGIDYEAAGRELTRLASIPGYLGPASKAHFILVAALGEV